MVSKKFCWEHIVFLEMKNQFEIIDEKIVVLTGLHLEPFLIMHRIRNTCWVFPHSNKTGSLAIVEKIAAHRFSQIGTVRWPIECKIPILAIVMSNIEAQLPRSGRPKPVPCWIGFYGPCCGTLQTPTGCRTIEIIGPIAIRPSIDRCVVTNRDCTDTFFGNLGMHQWAKKEDNKGSYDGFDHKRL